MRVAPLAAHAGLLESCKTETCCAQAAKSKSDARLAGALRPLAPAPAVSASAGAGERRPDKVIVFSQWTAMLDLLEVGQVSSDAPGCRLLGGDYYAPGVDRACHRCSCRVLGPRDPWPEQHIWHDAWLTFW